MAAETNLIKNADLVKAREIYFANQFGESVKKLTEALGVTRKIAKQAGTVLKTYKATGTLESGEVAEGDTIPLSKYKTESTPIGEITLKKWRKATSAEAIIDKGYSQAVSDTTERMIKDVQKQVRKDLFDFIATGTATAAGANLQGALAQSWGKLQTLFEDDAITAVYFVNPEDIADYLSSASITTQTAFGMNYVEDFLGLGTVIVNSSVKKGKIYATAKDNLVLYYVSANNADLEEAFAFTTDETGLIGIHETPDYTNMTASDTVVSGIKLFAERLDGVVVATISGSGSSGGSTEPGGEDAGTDTQSLNSVSAETTAKSVAKK